MTDVSLTATRSLQEQVSEEIRVLMVRKRLRQAEVARQLGWSKAYLNHRLMGRTAFDLHDLEALATLLEVPVRAFFGEPVTGVGGGDINLSKCAPSRGDLQKRLMQLRALRRAARLVHHLKPAVPLSEISTSGPLPSLAA